MEKVSIYKWRDALNIIEIMDYCSLIQYSRGPDHSPMNSTSIPLQPGTDDETPHLLQTF